jgi:hypothetical protein
VSFSTIPGLFPDYSPQNHDYVVRCQDTAVTVDSHASGDWEVAIAGGPFRGGDFVDLVPLSTGQAFTVTARQTGHPELYSYHVRCLPDDFPNFSFAQSGPVSPRLFAVDLEYTSDPTPYGIIFNNHGAPIWWYPAEAKAIRALPDGNLVWASHHVSPSTWEVHGLDGSLVRTLDPVGRGANPHDMQLTGNGDYLVGAYVQQRHVNTSAYGGSSDADVVNAELQQVTPGGQLVWDWKSQDHVSLAETGRMWPWVSHHPVAQGYDIAHWNSIEPDGTSVIASFRHFDAVYKINKSTGKIVWKLGGTTTPKSLSVNGDPRPYTFGNQHDARLLADGTLTVFDNRTTLRNRTPRMARFRIDQRTGQATLLQSISDPDAAPFSRCCGSARRLANGSWLIDWGDPNGIGGYTPDGERTFLLTLGSGSSYRAEPVTGSVSEQGLRAGMDAMYGTP